MSEPSYPEVSPFTFVHIPSDAALPVVEERFTGNSEGQLRDRLTRHFRKGLLSDAQKKEMAAHLMVKSTEQMERNAARAGAAGEKVEMDTEQQQRLIDTYLDQTSYEIVPITMPMRNTGFVGTSLYIDDSGAFKDLPLNTRASKIAQRDIRGDAFLLSNHDDPALDEWGRVDCPLATYEELYSSPPKQGYDTANAAQMAQTALLRESDTKRVTAEDAERAVRCREDGNGFVSSGDHKAAIQAYTLAVDLTEGRRDLLPNEAAVTALHLAALLNRSLCLLRERRYAEAAKDARRALAIDDRSAKAHYRLAQALIHLKEYDAARASVGAFVDCGGPRSDAGAMLAAIDEGEKRYKQEQKKVFAKLFS